MDKKQLSTVLKLMSQPDRLAILLLLLESEHSIGELSAATGLPSSVISTHLAKLRHAYVVDFTRFHRVIEYRLTSEETAQLLRTVRQILDASEAAATDSDASHPA